MINNKIISDKDHDNLIKKTANEIEKVGNLLSMLLILVKRFDEKCLFILRN